MFEPGWILIGFIEDRLGTQNNSIQPGSNPFPFSMGRQTALYSCNQTINSSPSQTSMAATNMFEPGWILIGFIEDRLGDTKHSIQPGSDPFPFSRGAKINWSTPNFPIFCVQTDNKFFSISNFHGGYKYVWAGLNPDWFHWGSSRDSTQFDSARLKPNPIFYGTPNFPIFFIQTLNSSPSQTPMAATNTFQPGWILIVFIDNRLGDT